ncbi:hypothetical protein HW561_06590 [Rhodobacteraceae bacterium B1Z28]|uniref:Uncharacterized protein n=1 Tax=Ruegeria haliotis TaxID=2747601 RepID=A0ABX2PMV1_9RHOB|nr:hypothetical protein [Ruegeria haliotis]NVO55452.1 hypothetical protein [Ruegeria haliotis]
MSIVWGYTLALGLVYCWGYAVYFVIIGFSRLRVLSGLIAVTFGYGILFSILPSSTLSQTPFLIGNGLCYVAISGAILMPQRVFGLKPMTRIAGFFFVVAGPLTVWAIIEGLKLAVPPAA